MLRIVELILLATANSNRKEANKKFNGKPLHPYFEEAS